MSEISTILVYRLLSRSAGHFCRTPGNGKPAWRPTGAAASYMENRLDGAIFRPASHATDANSISRKESIPDQDLGQNDVRMGESQGPVRPLHGGTQRNAATLKVSANVSDAWQASV